MAPSRTSACLALLGAIFQPRAAKRSSSCATSFGVASEVEAEGFGDGFAGEVVFGGAEAAAEDEDVGAEESVLRGRHEAAAVVADDAFEDYIDAEQVELLGEVERVGVHAVGSEQLGAHRDDFGVHAVRSLNEKRANDRGHEGRGGEAGSSPGFQPSSE